MIWSFPGNSTLWLVDWWSCMLGLCGSSTKPVAVAMTSGSGTAAMVSQDPKILGGRWFPPSGVSADGQQHLWLRSKEMPSGEEAKRPRDLGQKHRLWCRWALPGSLSKNLGALRHLWGDLRFHPIYGFRGVRQRPGRACGSCERGWCWKLKAQLPWPHTAELFGSRAKKGGPNHLYHSALTCLDSQWVGKCWEVLIFVQTPE